MNPKQALKKYFGYSSFRPGQEDIIKSVLAGKNVLAILPTGGGKSICYQIPALLGSSFSIVISPLIALMKDQVDTLNRESEIASFINSTLDFQEQERVLRNIAAGSTKILYIAPERLGHLKIIDRLKELSPDYLFVDEAHCISEWGHNFRPSYRKIKEFCDYTGLKRVSAFTATATPEVRNDIVKQLEFEYPDIFIKGFERDNLSAGVFKTGNKKEKTLELIKAYGTPAIVYCSTRKNAEDAVDFLRLNKINASFYHAGLQPEIRRIVQDDFLNDRIDVICSTNAFGMGIDKKDIRLVVHYNMTPTIENYYQEIGRAGRDGEESKAVMLFEPRDKHIQNFLIKNSYPEREQIKLVYTLLCDYGKIAVGSRSEYPVPVDNHFVSMCEINAVSRPILNASLQFLTNEGILTHISEYDQSHQVKILLPDAELKSYVKSVASVLSRDLLVYFLKKYGSIIFQKYVNIKINDISDFFEIPPDELIENLKTLFAAGIIDYRQPFDVPSYYLSAERVEARHLLFDFDKLYNLKQKAVDKLNEMEQLVFSRDCRFKIILNYFGENTDGYKCGMCDNCTGFLNTSPEMDNFINESIIETLSFLKEDTPLKVLETILWGTNQFYSDAPAFGKLSNLNKKTLKNNLANLCALKKIKSHKNHYSIVIKEISDSESQNFEKAEIKGDIALFEKLKDLRSDAARKFMQKPGLICPDNIIREIAETGPVTPSALLKITGFNQRMYNKIGEDIIELVKDHKSRSVSTSEVPDQLHFTKTLIGKKYNLKQISEILKVTEAVASLQIETIIQYYPDIEIGTLIKKENILLIMDEIKNGVNKAKEIKEILGGSVTYPEIRIVMAKANGKSAV